MADPHDLIQSHGLHGMRRDAIDLGVSLSLLTNFESIEESRPGLYVLLVEMCRLGTFVDESMLTEEEKRILVDKNLIQKVMGGGYVLTSQAYEVLRIKLGETHEDIVEILESLLADSPELLKAFNEIISGKGINKLHERELVASHLLCIDTQGKIMPVVYAANIFKAMRYTEKLEA